MSARRKGTKLRVEPAADAVVVMTPALSRCDSYQAERRHSWRTAVVERNLCHSGLQRSRAHCLWKVRKTPLLELTQGVPDPKSRHGAIRVVRVVNMNGFRR